MWTPKSNSPLPETVQFPEWLQHAESRILWKEVKLEYTYLYNKKKENHLSFSFRKCSWKASFSAQDYTNLEIIVWWWCIHSQLFSRVQLFLTPWAAAHQTPLSMAFSKQEILEWLPLLPPGNLPEIQGLNSNLSHSLSPGSPDGHMCIHAKSLQSCPTLRPYGL